MLSILLPLLAHSQPLPASSEDGKPEDRRPVSVLFDLTTEGEVDAWRPVHDTVMGGRSSGSAAPSDAGLRFTGVMSLENNGGFASLRRSMPAEALDGSAALALRVRGDGSIWKVGLQTPTGRFDVNWQAAFPTIAGEWTDVVLPYEAFTPTWRGQLVTGLGSVTPERARTMRIVIGEKQDGPFELEIAWIGSIERSSEEPEPRSVDAALMRTASLATRIDEGLEAAALLDTWQWSERLLVVSEPRRRGGVSIDATLMCGEFWGDWGALADRELRIVHLFGDDAGWVAGRELGRETVRALRETWELDSGRLTTALIGLDGGVKRTWDGVATPTETFALIDAMPMRRMRRRSL
ncbi:MAG: CIA30 family protein [Planctomycetota bacterium]|jgi:monofunctional biosynthetic peptidoglycan transglycosylase